MLTCHEVTRLVSESQDRVLSLREKWSLKIHLLVCTGCKNFSLQVPFLRKAMRGYASGMDEAVKK